MSRKVCALLLLLLVGCYRAAYNQGEALQAVAIWSVGEPYQSSTLRLHLQEFGSWSEGPLAHRRIVISLAARKLDATTDSAGDATIAIGDVFALICGVEKPTPPFDCGLAGIASGGAMAIALSVEGLSGSYRLVLPDGDRWLSCELGAGCWMYRDLVTGPLHKWQTTERNAWYARETARKESEARRWEGEVEAKEAKTGKCTKAHLERFELAVTNFNSALTGSGLRFLGRWQLVASPRGEKLDVIKENAGELDVWVLGLGITQIVLVDGYGNPVSAPAPYADVSSTIEYSVDADYQTRQVLASRNEKLALRVFGKGCSMVLLAGN